MPSIGADGAIRLTRVLRAPIATVFDALVKPELLKRWMCPTNYTIARVEADARPGGRFRLEMLKPDGSLHPASGTYTEVEAPNVLAFTWTWEMAAHSMAGLETHIRVELTAQGKDTTHLLMTHSGLPNDDERVSHNKGWTSVLDNLERLYEPGERTMNTAVAELNTGDHAVVSHEMWIARRKVLLEREKELTQLRDQVARERRALPWVKIAKNYVFDTLEGKKTLADLFEGRSQLLVQHFMFGPGWEQGCKSCSFMADHSDSTRVHLAQRDTTLVVVSRAPLAELERYRQRMGWQFKWASSNGTGFNYDFVVSFTPEQKARGEARYNYGTLAIAKAEEMPGVSAFFRDESGDVFHTYSTYGRGVEVMMHTYNLLDLTAKGRDEAPGEGMAWLRHHDRY